MYLVTESIRREHMDMQYYESLGTSYSKGARDNVVLEYLTISKGS